jgi:hypothetical protein
MVHESDRSVDRQAGQIPCESPRSSMGTSTSTAVGLSCPSHHAQTVRIGRRPGRSVMRLLSAITCRCRCELPNAPRVVMVFFVAMTLTLFGGRVGRSDEGCHFLRQVVCPVELQRGRSNRVAELFSDRRSTTRDDELRASIEPVAMSTLSPRSGRSCYTPVQRACVHNFAQRDRCSQCPAIIDAHFSPIITHAACVGALTITGMIDASATRRPSMPCTRRSAPTTASRSDAGPMRHVPAA